MEERERQRDRKRKRREEGELRRKKIPYKRGICKGQKEMVFHDVTHNVSMSGKVLEKADMDLFHFSNANYSCHVFQPCSRSKEYCVQGIKEDNYLYAASKLIRPS